MVAVWSTALGTYLPRIPRLLGASTPGYSPGLLCTRTAEILQVAALSNQIQTHLDAPNRLLKLNARDRFPSSAPRSPAPTLFDLFD